MLPSSPAPMPDTTNASDGLVQRGIIASSSSLDIRPSEYLVVAIFAPKGKPQMFPIKKVSISSLLIPRNRQIFDSKEQGGIRIKLTHTSARIKNGKSEGIMFVKHIFIP